MAAEARRLRPVDKVFGIEAAGRVLVETLPSWVQDLGLLVEAVEAGGEEDRGEPVFGGGAGDVAEALQRLVRAEVAGYVDPAFGVDFRLAPEGRTQREKRKQYWFHGSPRCAAAGGELDSTPGHPQGQRSF